MQRGTYGIQTPGTIDPSRTNSNTPFVAAVADNVGSSNPIVARVLLQDLEILNGCAVFDRPIADNAPGIQYLSDLRTCQEHAKKGRQTMIDDFKVLPNGSVAVPMWYVSGETPRPVGVEMRGPSNS